MCFFYFPPTIHLFIVLPLSFKKRGGEVGLLFYSINFSSFLLLNNNQKGKQEQKYFDQLVSMAKEECPNTSCNEMGVLHDDENSKDSELFSKYFFLCLFFLKLFIFLNFFIMQPETFQVWMEELLIFCSLGLDQLVFLMKHRRHSMIFYASHTIFFVTLHFPVNYQMKRSIMSENVLSSGEGYSTNLGSTKVLGHFIFMSSMTTCIGNYSGFFFSRTFLISFLFSHFYSLIFLFSNFFFVSPSTHPQKHKRHTIG